MPPRLPSAVLGHSARLLSALKSELVPFPAISHEKDQARHRAVPREAPLPTMTNMDLTCSNVADDNGCFRAQEATDDRGIYRVKGKTKVTNESF